MPSESFDTRDLRRVLGAFVTGVTIITTIDKAGTAFGLTANSFSSVSLDPPLVLWSQSIGAPSHPVFRDAERFIVNILAEDQIELSNRFAKGGGDKFSGLSVERGIGNLPIIPRCAAYLECRKVASYPSGDHTVFLGHVERIERTEQRPLAFGGGKYMVTQAHDLGGFSIDIGIATLGHLRAARVATKDLAELSNELDETLGLGVWGNHGPTIVRWEESKSPVSVNLRNGLVLPVSTSATGLAFAAYLPEALYAGFIATELAGGVDSNKQADPQALVRFHDKLEEVRREGIALLSGTTDFAELYGTSISAMCAPVFDASGLIVLGLTAIGHVEKLDLTPTSHARTALAQAAAHLSRRLGFQP